MAVSQEKEGVDLPRLRTGITGAPVAGTFSREGVDFDIPEMSIPEVPVPVQDGESREPKTAPQVVAPARPPVRQREKMSPGEMVMKSLAAAYPDRVGSAVFQGGDWAVPVRNTATGEETWFFYAEGRLLPEAIRNQWREFTPQPFYPYPEVLPPWKAYTKEESNKIREQERQGSGYPTKRAQHFFNALLRVYSKEDAWDRVKKILLFGHPVMVHYSILEELSLVEERILGLAKTIKAVQPWIDSLKSVDGWNWRNIASSESQSFHSYGTALDLLPKSSGGLQTYWLWTSSTIPEWWTVPYSKRLHPPMEVVKAFEDFGFIWGGKWFRYDTMHFEYRPEILIYNRFLRESEGGGVNQTP
jgi:hypothetical protein